MKLNIQQQLKQQLKSIKDKTYEEIKDSGGKIITPKDGSRIYFPSDNMVVDIKPLKFYNIGLMSGRIYHFENASEEYGASIRIAEMATSTWDKVFITDLEEVDHFGIEKLVYSVSTKIYVFLEGREVSPNCFIERNLKDVVSPETFDTFKDLYSFTKI
jgi:hypothetical protein